jgi:hypothetical protein
MAASRIAALTQPMTSTSQVIFSPSILDSGAAYHLKMSDLIVAGPDSVRERIRGSQTSAFSAGALRCKAARLASKSDSSSAYEVNNNRNEKNRSKKSAADHHVDLRCL